MRVRDLMTTILIAVEPETSVIDAKKTMAEHRIRHLLVMADDELRGIVTDRDIRLALPSPATSLSVWEINFLVAKLTVGEVMTKDPVTVGPGRSARDAARVMLERKIGALPVTEHGRVVGILTETDCLRAFAGVSVRATRAV